MNCVECLKVATEIPAVYFPMDVPLCAECFQTHIDDEEYWETRFKETEDDGK